MRFTVNPDTFLFRRIIAGAALVAGVGAVVACAPSNPSSVPSFTVNPTPGSAAPSSAPSSAAGTTTAAAPAGTTTAVAPAGTTDEQYTAPGTTTATYPTTTYPAGTTTATPNQYPTTIVIPPGIRLPTEVPRTITIPPNLPIPTP